MKKSELIERIAEKAEMSKAAAARAVDAIFDSGSGAIAEAVQAGKQVSIPGFGKFKSRERPARKGRNPRTGQEIDIPAGTVVSFSPGKGLKDSLAGRAASAKKNTGSSSGEKNSGSKSDTAGKKGKQKSLTIFRPHLWRR